MNWTREKQRYECDRCHHELIRGRMGGWLHWDEDDWYGGHCACADGDAECVAVLVEDYR